MSDAVRRSLCAALAALTALVLITSADAAHKKDRPTTAETREYNWNWQKDIEAAWYGPTEGVLEEALAGALADVEEVIFAARANGRDWHWYANFGYNIYGENRIYFGGEGTRLCALNLRTGEVRTILDDPVGDVRDPTVSYDGRTILFSYRRGESHQFHLYTVRADGSELTQLTEGKYDDIEPCWLPDGGIMFCSSRCMRWVPCWYSQVAIMYRCEADGSDLHPVSFGVENENTPWPMQDGRVAYTRWEYVDRSQTAYHGLWSINPDGTRPALLYDNLGTSNLYIDAKPIPGADKMVTIISPAHGRNEHRGRIGILDPAYGPEDTDAVRWLDRGYPGEAPKKKGHVPEETWRDPYAVSEDCFLAATLDRLAVMNGEGDYEIIYELPGDLNPKWNLHEPRPLVARPREQVMPRMTDPEQKTATMVLSDIYEGRDMEGIERGQIKSLLVMEELPRPASVCAYADAISSGPNYVLHRILGTVPVEPDGSAHFKVPAGRPIFFVAQDGKGLSAKFMASYISAMPGEQSSCVGCHERRTRTPETGYGGLTVAGVEEPPDEIQPVEGVPEIMDYLRDIQPIWDAKCVRCHSYEKYAGNVILEGDLGPAYCQSYTEIKRRRPGNYRLGGCNPGSAPEPYSVGSGKSLLVKKLMEGHKDVELSGREMRLIKLWLDSGTPFAGSYAAIGSANRDKKIKLDSGTKRVVKDRCAQCHKGAWWEKPGFLEGEIRNAGRRFNMTRPEKSMVLLAPLAKSAGGLGLCEAEEPVFESKEDPAYRLLLDFVHKVQKQYGPPRWFQDGFKPRDFYVREMKRFGALDEDFDPSEDKLDPYATDRRYFRNIYREGPGPVDFHR